MPEQLLENIGAVTLDLTDYPGEDLYSDGAVEDRMLEIAMHTAKEDINAVIAEEKSWPVLYHFSPLRHNLLDFLQEEFSGKKILEIGSGCGAMTGCLLQGAARVDCVELSKKRSLINAHRHKDAEQLHIYLGNFEQVEKRLDTDYDVVTLIGVLEYANGYLSTEEPYLDLLQAAKRHLKEDGLLLVAIENRLGMKYFAGASEDHSGIYYEGIEGYAADARAKTFSKPALENLCRQAGFAKQTFYYPLPDYKLPMAIYSDDYLPREGDLRDIIANYDRVRRVLFDEGKALLTAAADGLFPLFANSFLVLLKGGAQ